MPIKRSRPTQMWQFAACYHSAVTEGFAPEISTAKRKALSPTHERKVGALTSTVPLLQIRTKEDPLRGCFAHPFALRPRPCVYRRLPLIRPTLKFVVCNSTKGGDPVSHCLCPRSSREVTWILASTEGSAA